jgi:putative transposase
MPGYFYERDLPHFNPNDAPYFVTFSLFGHYERELQLLKQGKMKFAEYDALLDADLEGPHHLKDQRCAEIMHNKLQWLAEEVLTLHVWTIMSNHVHLLMALKPEQELNELLRLVKGSTSRECNKVLGLTGNIFWQSERYDRALRWREHRVTFNYIVQNPVKAGIVKHWREHPWTYVNEKLHFIP